MPRTPFIGVRISWLMFARNSDFARLAPSAACNAWGRSFVRSGARAGARRPVDCRLITSPANSSDNKAVLPAAQAEGVLLSDGNRGVRFQPSDQALPAISSLVTRSNRGLAARLAWESNSRFSGAATLS